MLGTFLYCFKQSWIIWSLWLVVNGLFQKESKQSGVEGVGWRLTFLKRSLKSLDLSLWFAFVTEALYTSGNAAKLLYPLEFPRPKTKTHAMEIPHDFFNQSWPGNFISFSLTPLESWISTFCLFIQYPWKFHVLNHPAPCLDFSGME